MGPKTGNPIDSQRKRDTLPPRREPYWARLAPGLFVGFRRLETGAGTWLVRNRDRDSGQQHYRALGTIVDANPYDAARRAALDWHAQMEKGAAPDILTVKGACEAYMEAMTDPGDENRKRRAAQDFDRLVFSDPIARVELHRLKEHQVRAWRDRMAAMPAKVGRSQRVKDTSRTPATVNRDLVSLRAALNLALDQKRVASDLAWRLALGPIKNADRARELVLSREQRRKLLDAARPAFRPFLEFLALLPLRPGAAAALVCSDYQPATSTLTIRLDKGQKRPRKLMLPASVKKIVEASRRSKLPGAPLFAQPAGSAWDKNAWAIAMRAAVAAAGLPEAATIYTVRHSGITDLVVDNKLDLLTIAQIAGTSVRMIEEHYGHLREHVAAAGLEALAL